MLRFVDHDFRFIIDKFINGFPTQLIYKWSAWDINAAASYYSCSSILKFLQMNNSIENVALAWSYLSYQHDDGNIAYNIFFGVMQGHGHSL